MVTLLKHISSSSCQGLVQLVCLVKETGEAFVYELHSGLPSAVKSVKHEEVFLIVHHEKTTVLTDVLEDTTVDEVKRILQGILKLDPKHMRLYKKDVLLAEGDQPVSTYGLTSSAASCLSPANLTLTLTLEE